MQEGKRLTVRELVKGLLDEDMDAIVAFETSHAGKTVLANECWQSGTFFMKKEPRIQKQYLMEDEIPKGKRDDFVKVLVLGTAARVDEGE